MLFIIEDPGQWICKDGERFFKRNLMLRQICPGLSLVPLEFKSHCGQMLPLWAEKTESDLIVSDLALAEIVPTIARKRREGALPARPSRQSAAFVLSQALSRVHVPLTDDDDGAAPSGNLPPAEGAGWRGGGIA